jgi:hypothetical protein
MNIIHVINLIQSLVRDGMSRSNQGSVVERDKSGERQDQQRFVRLTE